MYIHFGLYSYRVRRVAFRCDYCRTCRGERLAVRVRSFDVLHIFWVPLLPLGFIRRWFCATCQSRPHDYSGTRPVFRWTLVAFLVVMSATFWADMPGAEPWLLWALRIGLPLATLATIRWALRHRPEPDFDAALARVAPYSGWECPVCGQGEFLNAPGWRCRICDVTHEPAAARVLTRDGQAADSMARCRRRLPPRCSPR